MEGKIALEEHFSTDMNNKHWNAKGEDDRNGLAYARDVENRLLDPAACLKEMDRAGIELCVLSLTSPGVQSVVDPNEAMELARSSNNYAHSLIRKYPGRFSAFAAVPLQDPKCAGDELERAVNELGFKGALVNGFSNVGTGETVQYLDEKPVWEFWDRVSKLDVPVYLHPREQLPSQQRAVEGYPELGGSAWGFALETSTHAVRLMMSGLFDVYPNLQVILGHLGEGLPFMLPRLQHRLDEQREGEKGSTAARRPSHYFSNNFYINDERPLPYEAIARGDRANRSEPRPVFGRLPVRTNGRGRPLVRRSRVRQYAQASGRARKREQAVLVWPRRGER